MLHPFRFLHQLQSTLIHQLNFHLHFHLHNDAQDPIITTLATAARTNVHFPSVAALVVRDPPREHIARLVHVPPPDDNGPRRDLAAELPPSLSAQPLHDIENTTNDDVMSMNIQKQPTRGPIFNRPSGNTTHHHPVTIQTLSQNLPIMTTTPLTSGNPGTNGRTTLGPLDTTTTLDGSIMTDHQPPTSPPSIHPPDLSQLSHPTSTLLITTFVAPNTGQVPSNLVHPPRFLRDMSPLICMQDPNKIGFVLSTLPRNIPIECVRQTKFHPLSVPR